MGDRGEEARAGAAHLRVDPRLARFHLEAEAVDRRGQPGDQRLEQRTVSLPEGVLAAGGDLDLERRDGDGRGAPRSPRPARGGRRPRRAERAPDQPEQRDQRVGGAGHDGVGILTGHEPSGEVEADLGLPFALFGGAPRLVEPRDGPAQDAGRRGERDQRDQIVALLHVEALARRGEEVVQREERGHRADDRTDPTDERGEECGDEQEKRSGGEIDVEQPAHGGGETDDGQREQARGRRS